MTSPEREGYAPAAVTADPVRIVIVGGGFAGRTALLHFLSVSKKHKLSLTLVDDKPFFEFTPSILRCIVDPAHVAKITYPQKQSGDYEFVQGRASAVTSSHVTVQLEPSVDNAAKDRVLPFDYCIWAVGVSFSQPIHTNVNGASGFSVAHRQKELDDCRNEVLNARNVLIVGAGTVGVELAAELIHLVKDTKSPTTITLAASPRGLLPRLPPRAGKYAEKQLTSLGVKVIHARMHKKPNLSADNSEMEYVSSPDHVGEKVVLRPEVVFQCTGGTGHADVSPLVKGGVCEKGDVGADGCVDVRPSLQVKGHEHILVAGDAARAPGEYESDGKPVCEKTVYSAEAGAKLAACNVIAMLMKKKKGGKGEASMLSYPEDAFPFGRYPRVFIVSLYKADAVMAMESYVMCGRFADFLKWMIEVVGVASLKGRGFASVCAGMVPSWSSSPGSIA